MTIKRTLLISIPATAALFALALAVNASGYDAQWLKSLEKDMAAFELALKEAPASSAAMPAPANVVATAKPVWESFSIAEEAREDNGTPLVFLTPTPSEKAI